MANRRSRLLFTVPVWLLSITLMMVFSIFSGKYGLRSESLRNDWSYQSLPSERHLLASVRNCTPAAIEQFPKPIMDPEMRKEGGIVVHIFVSFYMFLALAVVCDDYFVPSLDRIVEVTDLQSDVAGATFMAAGSSAPELATSLIAVFIAKDDIGLGTVVGSAVFNVMFVVAFCALFAGMVVYLNWWPMFRDCCFYLLSIMLLLITIYDEEVTWYESTALLVCYVVYCVFMYFNPKMEKWVNSMKCPCQPNGPAQERTHLVTYNKMDESIADAEPEKNAPKSSEDSSAKLEDNDSIFDIPQHTGRQILWCLSMPVNLLCYITVPDCRKPRWRKWFIITFIMSMVWISVFSYVLVWMITIIGYTLGIPDTVMGLTFLAAGVSVPDAISSLLVAREGLGDMAVSNAVGSNVFDILVCLGLPWFLQTVVIKPNSVIPVISKGLTYSTISLLSTVVFLLLSVHFNKWKLDKKLGIILLIWYVCFMVLASLYELNIFGSYNPPECASTY